MVDKFWGAGEDQRGGRAFWYVIFRLRKGAVLLRQVSCS
jgi:predicted NAD-dependent protein-ADP-ribosyltransferase YbiA (DUF1768 family)